MKILDDALAAWTKTPCPELAALVARAGALAGAGREAITGLDHAERDAMWKRVEKAKDPADMDRLLATLVEGRCEQCLARMMTLAKRKHRDPRLVEQLVRYIEADPRQSRGESSPVPFTSGPNRKFWVSLLAIVEGRGDATHVPRLIAVAERITETNFEVWLGGKCREIAEDLEDQVPAKPDAKVIAKLEAAIAKLEAETVHTTATGDALWAAVWAAPDDDAPRIVLADHLSEQGDPRGEFITLQLARSSGKLDVLGKKREKELLKRHKKQWLGPIAPLIQPHYLRFDRGFLVTCALEPNEVLEAKLGKHPAWSTIKQFLIHGYAEETAKPLAAMLRKHGATSDVFPFTVGIE